MKIEATSLPPQDAHAFWQSKVPMAAKDYAALAVEARSRAIFVSGLAKGDLLNAIHASLGEALREGQTFQEWKKGLKTDLENSGWGGNRPWRLETIYRNNMQSAYMAGRYAQMRTTTALRPYWQMSVINDERTRPAHAALSDVVYPAEHPFWDTYYPPNGHRCRCTVKSRSQRQVDERGLKVEDELDPLREHPDYGLVNITPPPGFDRNVGKDWWAGVRELADKDVHPEAWAEAQNHPPADAARPKPVKSYDEMGKAIAERCQEFMPSKPIRVSTTRGNYLMATYSDGRIELSTRSFATPHGSFNPAKELKGAWNALAAGKPLDWKQEYAMESLWHEIMHNRQVVTRSLRGKRSALVAMETANQWLSRRTYHELIEKLGGKAVHQADILKNGLGYGGYLRNFDNLLARLGIRDADILQSMRVMHQGKPSDAYIEHLTGMLSKRNPAVSGGKIETLLKFLREDSEVYTALLDEFM